MEVVDPDGDITKFEYDANGNKIFKEYPNYETAYYFYDACDLVIEMDEFDLGGKKLFKTTYSWDAEGNLLTEMQYNHGQSGESAVTVDTAQLGETYAAIVEEASAEVETPAVELPVAFEGTETEEAAEAPALIGTEVFQTETEESTAVSETVDVDAPAAETEVPTAEVETPTVEVEAPEVSTETIDNTETGDSSDNSSSGNPEGFEWGNGNGEVPPGQNVDEDGNIVNNGGNTPPGLNRREKAEKPENPNKPEKPENPGEEDSSDKKANKAQQGTHIYTYDELNRMVTSDISKVESSYTYDTLGNLIYEKEKNVKTDYQYNELNQLVSRKQGNESYSYSYDKRGNRIAEAGKKETREYIYDETNHLVEGTNWKGDKSAYTYNSWFGRCLIGCIANSDNDFSWWWNFGSIWWK